MILDISRRHCLFSDKSHYENVPFEVPGNWCWVSLSDVCNVARGGSPRPIKEYLTDDKNGINWIKIGDADKDGKYINSTKEKISPSGISKSRMVHKGDFLLTNSMSFGRPYILNIDGCIHDGWLVISPIPKTYDPEFLYYLLSSGFAYSQFTEAASGGVVSNLNSDKVGNSLFPLPPQSEQKRIVSELEKLFKAIRLIDNNKLLFRHNIEQIRSKILELAISGKLVHQNTSDEPAIELLKRINPAYKPADNRHYRQLPDSWEICQLKDIFDITMGQSPAGDTINGKSGIEFHQGKLNFTEKYLSESGQYTTAPSKVAVPESLLLCVRAPVGIVNITKREICIGRGLCSLRPKYDIDCLFWLYMLSTLKDYFDENATGSTFKAISGEIIRNATIPFPPVPEQKRILLKINELFYFLDKITAVL